MAKCTFGILVFNLPVNEASNGLRGNVELTVISSGPGTNTKCVERVIKGYDAMRSAKLSKFSDTA